MHEQNQSNLVPEIPNITHQQPSPQFEEFINYNQCPLCGSESFTSYRTGDCSKYPIYKPILSPTIKWMKCNTCHHIFREGYYTDKALKVLFDETHTIQKVGNDLERQRIISARMIEKVLPYKSSGIWLDVGFGNGSLLFTAKEYGFTPFGVDLRQNNVDSIKKYGIQAVCHDINLLQLQPKCSVISMMDVLEHMPFPVQGLKTASNLLEANGLLFLSMPNCDSTVWQAMDTSNSNPYWGEMEHYHNFGRTRLYSLLNESGFKPIRYGISERYRVCMEVIAIKQ